MDITKCNEVFEINGTTDRYIVNGIADRDLSGHLNIDFRFSNLDEIELGNGWYNEYPENNYSDFGVSGSDENRIKLIEFANEVIDFVIEHFKSINYL